MIGFATGNSRKFEEIQDFWGFKSVDIKILITRKN